MSVKIFVDTSADMPRDIAEKYNIGVFSFLSIFGDKSYVTGTELTNERFYKMLETSKVIPTTSQTPYQVMYDELLAASREYDSVIYFTISSKGSGQFNTATMIAGEIRETENPDADIYIVDTEKYSLYIAQTAVKASEMAADGVPAAQIADYCKEYAQRWRALLLVDTLKYLEKGGRINKASAIIGTLLDIKPVLTIEHGLVEPLDKLRGKKNLLDKLIVKILEDPEFDDEKKEFLVVHSDINKGLEAVKKLRETFDISTVTMFGEFGPIVGTHLGAGAVAIIYRLKD